MGTVYRAHHLTMERDVAVKVLRGNLADDPVAARRFALEAKATTKVDSPYAVKVFDFGITAEGEYFMVMEYLDGRTAQRELDVDGPMAMARALHVARQAASALTSAHAVGIVHRDIKPENLLLLRVGDDPDACKVLDFGVAKLMASAAGELAASALTKEGMVFGTPEFMSPEQACGLPLDGRSDVYSLAATLFTLLTAEPLFRGKSAIDVLSKHVTAAPPRLTDLHGMHHLHALEQVLQCALAKRPDERYRGAAEFAQALAFLAPSAAPLGQAAATVPTPSFAPVATTTPDSPLGLIAGREQARRSEVSGPTGSEPLLSDADLDFLPRQTGYLPRLPAEMAPSTQALLRALAARRRRIGITFAAVIVSVLAAAALLLLAPGTPTAKRQGSSIQIAPPRPQPDGGTVAPRDAEAVRTPADAAISVPPREAESATPPRRVEPREPSRAKRLQQYLGEARAARAAGKGLRQLTQAKLALQLAPREPEAWFLAGDALLSAGDSVRGCEYLARATQLPAATARAASAGCR
jgi:eukaryotic-like serine/threonine-protein kinase